MSAAKRLFSNPNVRAWCLYDLGNSAFAVLYPVVFAVFYAETVVGNEDGEGSWWWGMVLSTAMFTAALSAPFLGGIADHTNRRKRMLLVFTLGGIASVLGFAGLAPGMVWGGFVVGVLASVCFEASNVFYNAYLPDLAPTDEQGRLSALGFAVGYAGSLLALGVAALLLQEGWLAWVWVALALQWGLASIPAFRRLPPDRPTQLGLVAAGIEGVRQTRKTLSDVWAMRNLRRFLVSYFFYMDGVHTVIVFASLYASKELGFTRPQLLGLVAVVQVTALLGALIMAKPADVKGPRWTVRVLLVWWVGVVVAAYFAPSKIGFTIVGALAGLGLGSIQSASRAFVSRLIPDGREAEMFGFYALCGKSGAIIGPLVFITITSTLGGDQRTALLSVIAFYVIGHVLLGRVSDAPAH